MTSDRGNGECQCTLNPIVSVVIPVYGVENYVSRCIESVINQTYRNLEIIIVNDATNDASMDIVRSFCDDRIKILEHVSNEGLAKSRNDGISIASGEYLIFLDSDDYWDLHFVEELLRTAQKEMVDVVMAATRVISKEKIHYLMNSEKKIDKYFAKIMALPNGGSCNKIYRKDFINRYGLRFPVGKYWEDNVFTVKVAFYSNCFACINSSCYNYCIRGESITRDLSKIRKWKEDSLFVAEEILSFSKQEKCSLEEEIAVRSFILKNFVRKECLEDPCYKNKLLRLFLKEYPIKVDTIFVISLFLKYYTSRVLRKFSFGSLKAKFSAKRKSYRSCIHYFEFLK